MVLSIAGVVVGSAAEAGVDVADGEDAGGGKDKGKGRGGNDVGYG